MAEQIKKIVLASSGGVDMSVILRWLIEICQREIVGRKSAVSLCNPDFATFEADQVYQQADATGFIRLNALGFCAGAQEPGLKGTREPLWN